MLESGRSLIQFLLFIYRGMIDNRCFDTASVLTLTTLFSLVPALTVIYAVLSVVPQLQQTGAEIETWIFTHFLPTSGSQLQDYLTEFTQQTQKLTTVGLVVVAVTALSILARIERSLNTIWQITEAKYAWWIRLLRYWLVMFLGPLLLTAGLVISSYVMTTELWSETNRLLGLDQTLLKQLPLLLSCLAFSLVYWLAPHCRVPWRSALLAGLLIGVLFEVAKAGFAWYLKVFPSYQLVYGAFAILPIFILWLYISWLLFLLGAEVSFAIVKNYLGDK